MNVPVSILGDYLQICFFFFTCNIVEKKSLIVKKNCHKDGIGRLRNLLENKNASHSAFYSIKLLVRY